MPHGASSIAVLKLGSMHWGWCSIQKHYTLVIATSVLLLAIVTPRSDCTVCMYVKRQNARVKFEVHGGCT